jgi:nicotinamidase-related amidase
VYNQLGYSETDIPLLFSEYKIDQVYVVGLALDFCVKYTAVDVRTKLRIPTTVLLDATRAVAPATTGKAAIATLKSVGVRFANTTDI